MNTPSALFQPDRTQSLVEAAQSRKDIRYTLGLLRDPSRAFAE